jgi:hypothetical protein
VEYWDYSQKVIAKFTSKELLDKSRDEILLGERVGPVLTGYAEEFAEG